MSDAKVAYDYDDRGKVRRQSRFGQNLPQTGLSVFSPKNLPLPATRLKSIQQREQATDGKLKGIKERFTDEAGYYASSVSCCNTGQMANFAPSRKSGCPLSIGGAVAVIQHPLNVQP